MKTVYVTYSDFNSLPEYPDLPPRLKQGFKWKKKTDEGWLMGEVVLRGKTGIEWSKIMVKTNG